MEKKGERKMAALRITRFTRVLAVVVIGVVALAMTTGVAYAASGPVDVNPADFVIGLFLEAVLIAVVVLSIGAAMLVLRRR